MHLLTLSYFQQHSRQQNRLYLTDKYRYNRTVVTQSSYSFYESLLKRLTNTLRLLSVKLRLRLLTFWFDGECRQHRCRTPCFERRYRRSGARPTAWHGSPNFGHSIAFVITKSFQKHLVVRNEENPKRPLYFHLGPPRTCPPFVCRSFLLCRDDFLQIVTEKIESLRASISDAPPLPQFSISLNEFKFYGFRCKSQFQRVQKLMYTCIIRVCTNKSLAVLFTNLASHFLEKPFVTQ